MKERKSEWEKQEGNYLFHCEIETERMRESKRERERERASKCVGER